MLKCLKCESEYYEGMKFCGQCGQALERACTHCGYTNPPHFKFCSECGHQFVTFPSVRKQEKPASEVARKHITIHFSDLSGYTSLGERLEPEVVKGIMNRILDPFLVAREGAVMDLTIAYNIEKSLCGTISVEIAPEKGVSCGGVFSEDRANTHPYGL
jgi:adenylate cyclase